MQEKLRSQFYEGSCTPCLILKHYRYQIVYIPPKKNLRILPVVVALLNSIYRRTIIHHTSRVLFIAFFVCFPLWATALYAGTFAN